jgi:hypothetical protein
MCISRLVDGRILVVDDDSPTPPDARADVDGVDLTVHPGDIYRFLGPNRAGQLVELRAVIRRVEDEFFAPWPREPARHSTTHCSCSRSTTIRAAAPISVPARTLAG